MDDRIVNQWLERVLHLANSEHQNDLVSCLPELREFLHELHKQLIQWGRPGVALNNIPSIARLFGQLCKSTVLMAREADYQLLFRCVLLLHTSEPGDELEELAVKWVGSQIRESVSFHEGENLRSAVGETVDCLANEYNRRATIKLLNSMTSDLQNIPLTRWDPFINCRIPAHQPSSQVLRDLTDLFCPLLATNNHALSPLVGCLLSCHGNDAEEAMSPAFLEAVVASQQHAYTDQRCSLELSYRARVALWTRHLPAFETEFLSLVRALTRVLPSSRAAGWQLLASRQVPKACAQNPQLLTSAEHWIQLLVQQTGGSAQALDVGQLFRESVENDRQLSATI